MSMVKRCALGFIGLFSALAGCAEKAGNPSRDSVVVESYRAHIAAANGALRLNETANARDWLARAPGGTRNWEWRYLLAQTDETRGVYSRVSGQVFDFAMSPDSRLLAVVGANVTLLDRESGRVIRTFGSHTGEVYHAAFSPDSRQLLTAGADRTARIHDVETGEERFVYREMNVPVTSVAWFADGSRVAAANYRQEKASDGSVRVIGTVRIWNPQTGAELEVLSGGIKPISKICLRPDGKSIAAATWDGDVHVWRLGTPEPTLTLSLGKGDVYTALNGVAYSRKGDKLVAGSKDRTARVWDAASGKELATLPHSGWVTAAVFSPDDTLLATTSLDNLVRIYDTANWRLISTLRGHTDGPWALAWLDHRSIITGGTSGNLLSWDVRDPTVHGLGLRDARGTYAAIFIPDGKELISCCFDGTISIRDANSGESVRQWAAHEGNTCNLIALSGNGERILSCSWDGILKLWDREGSLKRSISTRGGNYACTISPNGRFIAASLARSEAGIWDPDTGSLLHTIQGLQGVVQALAFSTDGKWLAVGSSGGNVRVIRAADWQTLAEWQSPGSVHSCSFSPAADRLVTAGTDGTVRGWRTKDGSLAFESAVAPTALHRVAYSPDGSRIAVAGSACHLLDSTDGLLLLSWQPHTDEIWNLSFNSDGTRLATCSWNGTIQVSETKCYRDRRAARPR